MTPPSVSRTRLVIAIKYPTNKNQLFCIPLDLHGNPMEPYVLPNRYIQDELVTPNMVMLAVEVLYDNGIADMQPAKIKYLEYRDDSYHLYTRMIDGGKKFVRKFNKLIGELVTEFKSDMQELNAEKVEVVDGQEFKIY